MHMLNRILQSRLARQFATLLSGRVAAAAIQTVSIYLLARWSDVDAFGMFAAALGMAVTLQAVGDAGATVFVVRETAAHGITRKVAYAELLSRLTMGSIALLGAGLVLVLDLAAGGGYLVLLPMLGWIVIDRSSEIRSAIARGLGDVRIGTTNLISRRALQLLLFVVAHKAGMPASWAYSSSLMLGSAMVLMAMWRILPRPPRVRLRAPPLKHALQRCMPYWLNTAFTQLRNIDTVIVAALSGATQAAYYGVGARLMTPLRMIPATLATALLPHLTRRRDSNQGDIKLGLVLATLIALPYLLIVVAAPWILKYLGPDYAGSVLPLQIMCVGLASSSFTSIFNVILQARGLARLVARFSMLTTAVFLLLVTTGAALQGAVGAAVGFMLATFIQAIVVVYGTKSHA